MAGASEQLVYLDNAATSFPKPPQVMEAMRHFTECVGANPGRSGHRLSIEAGRVLLEAREQIAALINAPDPLEIVLTKNATEGLNTALLGTLTEGDEVITTSMEHNSVARPLKYLERCGVRTTVVRADERGFLDPEALSSAVTAATKAIVMTHASNVTGTIMPIAEVGAICGERDLLFIVDAAQTGGALPIDVQSSGIDLLALTGHKSLLGPQGTGALYVRQGLAVEPRSFGGTGSSSESDRQPDFLPDSLESGTANTVGAAGLAAGVRFVRSEGIEAIRSHEVRLSQALLDGLASIEGVRLWGPDSAEERTPIIAFTVDGMASDEVGFLLDQRYGVLVRVGLQCSPWSHRTIGSFPEGTIRASCGYFTTLEDCARTIEALREVVSESSPARKAVVRGEV